MRRLWDKEKLFRLISSSPHLLISLSPYLIITLTVLLATWKLSFADRIIARGDLLLYFYPLREYASQALRAGRLPLWNPFTFMGAPFLANSQVGFFYPFNVLLAWLPVEKQVSVSIVLHLIIATLGMYALMVAGLKVGRLAGLAAAISFGLGGYLSAQVEHLNQLQVLAWLPVEVLAIGYWQSSTSRLPITNSQWPSLVRRLLLLSVLIALQVLAGHTQSLYICLVTLGLVIFTQLATQLWQHRRSPSPLPPFSLSPLLLVLLAGLLAALVCAVQLLPTLELSRESYRSGGLSFGEAAAFSWRPWVIARALLPTYGDPLFPEYVSYFGVAGLALAVLGVMPERLEIRDWRLVSQSPISNLQSLNLMACVLVLAGFVLALGVVTPMFNVLYKVLPGFNLFRAQARWLVMLALGMSMLIGLGTQALLDGPSITTKRNWLLAWLVLIGLIVIGLLVGIRISPEAEYKTLPAQRVWLSWVATAACVTTLAIGYWRLPIANSQSPISKSAHAMLPLLLLIELFAASQFQSYSRAADRQALTSLRPSTAHLLAGQALTPRQQTGGPSPGGEGRILALSGLFFDPGDLPEQTLIYGKQLNKDELYDRVIASKHKEILSPNLSLYYGLPSVDGYDGGLLPTRRFVQFASQFTPTPKTGALDGRLREFLKAVPENKWLAQMGVRYIIADKTQDVFIEGVYYDLFTSVPLSDTANVQLSEPYSATALGMVLSGTLPTQPFQVGIDFASGVRSVALEVQPDAFKPYQSYWHLKLNWPVRAQAQALRFSNVPPSLTLLGLTSIDATDHSFMPQQMHSVFGNLRLAYSGDVKIYENQSAAPRAHWGDGTPATIVVDEPERVVIANSLNKTGELTLRDACYLGWVARVDGVETAIECTDILFRKISVPNPAKEIVFSYEPQSVRLGAALSGIGLLAWGALAVAAFVRRHRNI